MTLGGYIQSWKSLPRPQLGMILVLAVAVVLANIAQPFPHVAPLQHIPTVLLILASPALLARWPLSNSALAAVAGFLQVGCAKGHGDRFVRIGAGDRVVLAARTGDAGRYGE